MLFWRGLEPHRLPYATAGRIPDHSAAVQGLLPNWNLNAVDVSRVISVHQTARLSAFLLSAFLDPALLTAHWFRWNSDEELHQR